MICYARIRLSSVNMIGILPFLQIFLSQFIIEQNLQHDICLWSPDKDGSFLTQINSAGIQWKQ